MDGLNAETYEPTIVTMTPYQMQVAIIWSPDEQQVLSQWLRNKGDKWVDWGDFVGNTEWACAGTTWTGRIDDLHVLGVNLPQFVHNGASLAELMGTVAHEASHVMTSLCDIIGYRPDPAHDEPYAYALAHLVQAAMESCPADFREVKAAVKRVAGKKS